MKKVVIIGATGMLGSMVYEQLKDAFPLVLVYRDKKRFALLEEHFGGTKKHEATMIDLSSLYDGFVKNSTTLQTKMQELIRSWSHAYTIINCAGIIRPGNSSDQTMTFFINSAFPHLLSRVFEERLIHISTDCVFDGKKGAPYSESDPPNPSDIYGLSKSLGEPLERSFVIRTSIIGPELEGKTSLWEWFRHSSGKIKGYTNHVWNGVTTKQLGIILRQILLHRQDYPSRGLYHIFSDAHTKYEILTLLQKKLLHKVTIIKYASPEAVDRRLASIYPVVHKLNIPTLESMLDDI